MVKYSIAKDDIKDKAKDLVIFRLKKWLIIGAVALPFSLYCLIVGYSIPDKEMLVMGYPALLLSALCAVLYAKWYSTAKKALLNFFDKYGVGDRIECEIERIENDIRVSNAFESFSFSLDDIKKTSYTKKHVVIMLKNGKLLGIPISEDVLKLFQNPTL